MDIALSGVRSLVARAILLGYNWCMDGSNRNGQNDEISLHYVPCGSEEEAANIARTLLAEHLIACGNIYPSRSVYVWRGDVAEEQEYLLLCKTSPSRLDPAARRVEQLHSYEIPCIIRFETARANGSYAAWVRENVESGVVSGAREKTQEK